MVGQIHASSAQCIELIRKFFKQHKILTVMLCILSLPSMDTNKTTNNFILPGKILNIVQRKIKEAKTMKQLKHRSSTGSLAIPLTIDEFEN